MMKLPCLPFLRTLAVAASLVAAGTAQAQDYPTRPITVVNPWAAGGASDAVARPIMDKLSKVLGQSIVLENKPGANGTIGAAQVARATPDGYTIYFSHVGPVAISPALQELPYDTMRDLQAVTQVVSSPLMLVVRPDLPVNSVPELIAYAKSNPGKLTYGSVGPGSTTHLAGELFDQLAGVSTLHVPYKGDAPATVDMIGGQIDFAFMNIGAMMPHVTAGRLRGIAVTSASRSTVMPELPAVAETLPGFEVSSWYGVMVPAGTPKPIVDRLSREIGKIAKEPELVEMFKARGLDVVTSTPEEHSAYVQVNIKRWSELIRSAGIKLN